MLNLVCGSNFCALRINKVFVELSVLNQKLLKIRREEKKEQGKATRKYYWSFNDLKIKQEAKRKPKKDEYRIYKHIPQTVWSHRHPNN